MQISRESVGGGAGCRVQLTAARGRAGAIRVRLETVYTFSLDKPMRITAAE